MTEPRILRPRQAHRYLGMGRTMFNKFVRPYVAEFPLGGRGVGFDKQQLDRWLEEYIRDRGRPGRNIGKGVPCEPGHQEFSVTALERERSTSSTRASASLPASDESARTKPKRGSGRGKPSSTQGANTNFEKALRSCSQLLR